MTNLLPDYVYANLKRYGNASIGYKNLMMLGEDAILSDLAKNGFNCKIVICKDENRQVLEYAMTFDKKQRTYAIAKLKEG